MSIQVKQSSRASLLDSRTMIIEITMQDLNNSEGSFEKTWRFVDGVQKLVFINLGNDGYD